MVDLITSSYNRPVDVVFVVQPNQHNHNTEDWVIESILKKRIRKDDGYRFGYFVSEYYIKWDGLSSESNAWYTEDELFDMGVTNFESQKNSYDSRAKIANVIKKNNNPHYLIHPSGRKH